MMTLILAPALAALEMSKRNSWGAGWGTLALVNAGLAQSKKRGGLNWFLISLFLGPLATLLIVILDPPGE